ncbi:MAG: HNH endonuclease signature motif containing protein, partial [Mobilicoccus sp.]|nr:HNH endonuclease signature motif containing protein [Mobilicoccus sp.]
KARVTVTIQYGDLLRDVHTDATDAGDAEDPCCDTDAGTAGAAFGIRTNTNSANTRRGYATTGFGTVISPTEARLLACDAQIIPIVLGTQGEILDQGRAHRTVTPAQIAALHARDGGCSFPGCSMPPTWCDAHHLVHWINGGCSDMCNLALLCRHHHTVVHRHDLTAVVTDAGVRWQRSNGDPISIRPRWG